MYMQAAHALVDRIITYIVDPAILLIFSVGFLMFMFGLVNFIANPEDATRRQTGVRHMIWGLVGMFVMIAVNGIIDIVIGTFDLQVPPQPFSGPRGGGNPFGNGGFPIR